jgi:hypothetical protein
METAKLAKGSERKPIRHSSTSAPNRAARNKAESARPPRKETGSKSKLEKLVCRYCGSDDLAPSFIKRRDRRWPAVFRKTVWIGGPGEEDEGQEIVLTRFRMWAGLEWPRPLLFYRPAQERGL